MAITASITVATVNTTATNRSRGRRRLSANATAALAGAVGLALVVSGGIRLASALLALEPRAVLADAYDNADVPPAALLDAARGIERAGALSADAELAAGRTYLLLSALPELPPDQRPPVRAEAQANAERVLATAPGQPAHWYHLAWLRERQGDIPGAVAALRLSMLSGPFVPQLMVQRTAMGVRLLPYLEGDNRAIFKRQVRLTWLMAPDFLLDLKTRPATAALVTEAMRDLTDDEIARGRRVHGKLPE